ncbi:hypothetical protein QBC38DRAFT_524178 [Podospora fimiseda]|uniref:Rhodopsin domain-containing protein n=1 Tax=Podospora fimiseda TaxID=252190 RepID=A0AAN6YM75_9PEZI|nr:hypothetical protein QBC38DRAFT_524178 [Podospora fimiseda]
MADSNALTPETFLGLGISLTILAGVFVVIRNVVDILKTKKFLIEDAVAISAAAALAASIPLNYLTMVVDYAAPGVTIFYVTQIAFAVILVQGYSLWSAKIPILMLYVRLFGVNNKLRYTAYSLILANTIILGSGTTFSAANCGPKRSIDVVVLAKCADRSALSGVVQASFTVVIDLIILILPLPTLASLRLPKGRKVGLFVVFLTGIFAFAASVVNFYLRILMYTKGQYPDFAIWNAGAICNVIESSIAIIVGCVPAAWAFWTNYVTSSAVYTRIRSGFSSLGVSAKTWPNRSTKNNSRVTQKAGSTASQQQIYVTSEFRSYEEHYKMQSQERVRPV